MKHCIACGHSLPQRCLFELKDAPASAQDIPDQEEVKTDQGMTLHLYQCERCGLVQFDCEPVPYYRDVIRAGGFSTTMTELRRRVPSSDRDVSPGRKEVPGGGLRQR